MIETTIEVQGSTTETIQALLRQMLAAGAVDAWLVPVRVPGGSVAPMLVKDPAALAHADPLAPVLPINAARAASQLTMTGHHETLGVVLRACEIRALVELVKFQQAGLDDVLVVGVDCLGTYPVTAYGAVADKSALVEGARARAARAEIEPADGMAFREACTMCEAPLPEGEHVALTVGLVGVEPDRLYLQARADVAAALELEAGSAPASRQDAVQQLVTARTQARDEALAAFRARVGGTADMQGLLGEFAACIRCHNCMINCPICYCRECIFRTPTFEHESQLFYQWADRKGTVRMLPDTLLFHLTRMNHMATSCVGCGICSDVCPVDIAVATAFRAVAERAQAIFDYHPGRSLDEAAPVQEFREDELTQMGKRPNA
ncbi:MAG: 4Fe-4S dicluster domain-containing protein [Anaerolineae bacterium]|jgi:formate dehydrogenase subunit beta